MIEFPYGIADFHTIRRDGMLYVDRTAYLREVERLGRVLVFLRPRRFGKSLWLQTLANYYDVRLEDEFDRLFGDLDIGGPAGPTALRNRFFVLQWNFSEVDADGGVSEIKKSLRAHVISRAKTFAAQYQDRLPQPIEIEGSPAAVLDGILRVVEQTPHNLYLLVDEYDNFINDVMVSDVETYRALFGKDGPYKQVFKSVKAALEGRGLERIFVTGVSPVALNDLTSGFNIAKDVSLEPELAALCGFRASEIRDILQLVARERGLSPETVDDLADEMSAWYNGYRFTITEPELVYNPTNVLYFIEHVYRLGKPPEVLYDQNLRTDRGKLAFLARTAAGAGVIERLTEGDDTIAISRLEKSFSFDDLVARIGRDPNAVASLLYYMGLLTLADAPLRLRIPNQVVKKLFLDRLLEIFLPEVEDSSEARELARRVFQEGDIRPLCAFFEEKLLKVLSNRDQGAAPRRPGQSGSGVNETVIKTLFLAILFDDDRYEIASETELERSYADLCLLVRDEMRQYGFFDLLFEFKLVRRKELGKPARELRDSDEAALRKVPSVAKAFAEARKQVGLYREALLKSRGDSKLNLKSYVVVAVGLERILSDEIEAP